MPPILLVAVGGVLGANARFLVANWAGDRYGQSFPYGTLLVNVSGSFLLGLVATVIAERYAGHREASLLLGAGFLGAYTTFSTLCAETIGLLQRGWFRAAFASLLFNAVGGIVAALLGIGLGLVTT